MKWGPMSAVVWNGDQGGHSIDWGPGVLWCGMETKEAMV